MSEPKKTSTPTLILALRILAEEIDSPDGVAAMAIAEGADRIEELTAEIERWRTATAKMRDAMEESARVANSELADAIQSGTQWQLDAEKYQRENDALRCEMMDMKAALARHDAGEPANHPDTERLEKLAALGPVAIWHGSYSVIHPDTSLAGGEVVEIIRMDDDCGESTGDVIGAGRTLGAAIDAARKEVSP